MTSTAEQRANRWPFNCGVCLRIGCGRSAVTLVAVALYFFVSTVVGGASASDRVALVIGNARYAHAPVLANPTNDATDIGSALARLGFEVTRLENVDYADLRRGLQAFSLAASASEVAMVFYAGHGIEIDGRNYLVPVDARLASDQDVEFETVPLDLVTRAVERARGLRVVILDACRENPFAAAMQRAGATRSIGRGLARVEPSGETLIAYAAKEGTLASDGAGRNSPYSHALLSHLEEPGLEVMLMFRKVRDAVLAATGGRQEPFVYGSLSSRGAWLGAPPEEGPDTTLSEAPTASSVMTSQIAVQALAAEQLFWESVKESEDPEDIQAYLAQYPGGTYEALARNRLRRLVGSADAAKEPKPDSTGTATLESVSETGRLTAEMLAAEREFWASVKDSADPRELETYLNVYPTGSFAVLARHRLDRLVAAGVDEGDLTAAHETTGVRNTVADIEVAEASPEATEDALSLSRDERRAIQQGLALLGFDPGPADGLFGPDTRSAIGNWQVSLSLPSTGHLDVETAKTLLGLAPDLTGGMWWIAVNKPCKLWNSSPQPGDTVEWSGDCTNGKASGNGEAHWSSTAYGKKYYFGNYLEGKKHGWGAVRLADGTHYAGEWLHDRQHGKGVFTKTDGIHYEASWQDGTMSDQGVITWSNGHRYAGQWKDGVPHGKGKITTPVGESYEGEWYMGRTHGIGALTNSYGDTYEGEFVHGDFHGYGTLVYSDGDTYEGEWQNYQPHGYGTLTFADGETYEGNWTRGCFGNQDERWATLNTSAEICGFE